MPVPTVSVIIPTYNRKVSLLRTLDSLSQQSFPFNRFEVIVIDDGGSDGTETAVNRLFPFVVHYLYQENQGEIVARNVGAQRSVGEILVFLDDDIEINQDYLEGLVAVHKTIPRAVVLGVLVEVANDTGNRTGLQRANSRPGLRTEIEKVTFIDSMSGIVSISHRGYFQVGLMQPLVIGDGRNIWGGIDFGYRAYQHGFTFWRARNAIAYHHDHTLTNLQARCRRNYRISKAVHDLFVKYPDLKGMIPMFHDKGPIEWTRDPPMLIARKIARKIASSPPILLMMEQAIPILERQASTSKLLVLLHRWIVSGYIYRGYHEGLRRNY